MKQSLCILLLALLGISNIFAQVDLRLGPEVGYGIGGLPYTDQFAHSYSSYEYNYGICHGGLIGLNARWLFGKHWQLQHGLDYQCNVRHVDGSGGYTSYNYYRESHTVDGHWFSHQVMVPVTWGYSFQRKKLRQSFQLGVRMGYLLANTERLHLEYITWTYPSPKPEPTIKNGDILPSELGQRFSAQALFCAQTEIGQQLVVSFSLAMGPPMKAFSSNGFFANPNAIAFFSVGYRLLGHEFAKKESR